MIRKNQSTVHQGGLVANKIGSGSGSGYKFAVLMHFLKYIQRNTVTGTQINKKN
jgi:hypothetical protein